MFDVIVPYYNGQQHINKLLASIPEAIRVIIVDDLSQGHIPPLDRPNTEVIYMTEKGYFTGAANRGIEASNNDVLILNQDTYFTGNKWLNFIEQHKETYALFGEAAGTHPAWPKRYVHGTFMYIRRDLIDIIGLMNAEYYPHWGSTAEYQLRAARKGFRVQSLKAIPDFVHKRRGPYGTATQQMLNQGGKRGELIRTPPAISVVITCYNYGRYLQDAVNSLIGGKTSLGVLPGQSFQSFEIIIVDDGSTDNSAAIAESLADDYKGIHFVHQENKGSASACNTGIGAAMGGRLRDGHMIAILDGDDMMESLRLERMLKTHQDNPHSVIYDNVQYFANNKRGGIVQDWQNPDKTISRLDLGSYDFERMLKKNKMHKGLLYPKRAWIEVGGYPEIMTKGREDWAFNIALGIKGWCGVSTGEFDYLYRKEGQGRSHTNTTPKHYQQFLVQLQQLFPDIYEGHRPMACCGRGPAQSSNGVSAMSSRSKDLVGQEGMVIVEYIGGNAGDETWHGQYGVYKLGGVNRQGYIDKRDKEILLGLRDNGKQVFKEVIPVEMPTVIVEEKSRQQDLSKILNTVTSLKDAISDLTLSELHSTLDLEKSGKNRSTAIEAIEEALDDRYSEREQLV